VKIRTVTDDARIAAEIRWQQRRAAEAMAMRSLMGDVIDALEQDKEHGLLSEGTRKLVVELLDADAECEQFPRGGR